MRQDHAAARAEFAACIAAATTREAAFAALHAYARALVPARLFTVTLIDMEAGLARRAYTSDEAAYPTQGTKPVVRDEWFETIRTTRRTHVSNDISGERDQFPDFDLILSLGCRAIVNLPIALRDDLVGTVNLLDVRDSYPPEAVALIDTDLRIAAMLATAVALTTG